MAEQWNGFRCERFEFEGKQAILVFPDKADPHGNWALKTEYWNAFPQLETELVRQGFHLAYLQNETRFATRADCERKARFVRYLSATYGLRASCFPIGYSCGGAHAVNFAGYFPQCVVGLVIDAPVLNFCDYPGRLSDAECESVWEKEFVLAYPGITRASLLQCADHPLCRIPTLKERRIPILMLYGTEDQTVRYDRNGRLLELEYRDAPELLTVIPRMLQGHHPHGFLPNPNDRRVYDWIFATAER